ncbi:lytic transglycosylase domain-containing protein [Comamonadaceae bacterium OH2545_COT-014]|nr:lytic transglycosylase domain-containing protein [Comamonadaceae bacterium OH2545_COT-014]
MSPARCPRLTLCQKSLSGLMGKVFMLSFLMISALPVRADLWAHLDSQGAIHFAAEPLGARGQMRFPGASLERLARFKDATARLKEVNQRLPLPPGFAALEQSSRYHAVQEHLHAAAREHALDYRLLKAVAAAESSFNPAAVSRRGAVGLMQLMPATARQYGVAPERLADPRANIDAGARHLKYLMQRFQGRLALAVAAYNAGEGAVRRAGNQVPGYPETQGYVQTVMQLYGGFRPHPASAARPLFNAAARPAPPTRLRVTLPPAFSSPVLPHE